MSDGETPSRFVIDTHTWHWYLQDDPQLSPGARAAMKLVELGEAQLLTPAIVVAELVCLWEKLRIPSPLEAVTQAITANRNMLLVDIGLAQLSAFEKLDPTLEMHDRLILAAAVLAKATLITKDYRLQRSGMVPTIW